MKAKFDSLKAVHTRFSQANALVASARERGEVTAEKHRMTNGALNSTVVSLADVSKKTPEEIDAIKAAIKIVNAGWTAQNVLKFKFADLAEISKEHEKLEARIAGLEKPPAIEKRPATASASKVA